MESDIQFYTIFSNCPGLFGPFAGFEIGNDYRFAAYELKDIKRTCDGLLVSSDPAAPSIVVEFQVGRNADVYPRIFIEMGMYQLENPGRIVRGVLIFLNRERDPRPPTWSAIETCDGSFRVLYLDELLRDLGQNQPLNAAFQPLLAKSENQIRQNAKHWLHVIRENAADPKEQATLERVFFSFLTQTFKDMTKEQLMIGLGFDVPVQETVFYKQVIEEGRQEGRQEGREEGINQVLKVMASMNADPEFIAKVIEQTKKPNSP
jgi:predicted transposase YdaD